MKQLRNNKTQINQHPVDWRLSIIHILVRFSHLEKQPTVDKTFGVKHHSFLLCQGKFRVSTTIFLKEICFEQETPKFSGVKGHYKSVYSSVVFQILSTVLRKSSIRCQDPSRWPLSRSVWPWIATFLLYICPHVWNGSWSPLQALNDFESNNHRIFRIIALKALPDLQLR